MDPNATDTPETRTLVLGGGCFWCLDAFYRTVKGVRSVTSGYTGGHTPDPYYEQVCSGASGHAEAVRVVFDPEVIPARVILAMFFAMHNPTTLNRQGWDIGTQYRSTIFVADAQDERDAKDAIAAAQELWPDPIVTTIEPLGEFHTAEAIHQDYYSRFPEAGYCQAIVSPKLASARKGFAEWVQPTR
ncbi:MULTISPECIES: peptide-methionine (S)-S-oxide reductase MsrA [Micrococcaceae]|uniref:Peptide methionine sulfoxide reductase MsrA n=1 Tax=Falsarthrobacter nasiphocae TaxID=189863 RepID=A0AAE3YJ23_9MICC|nr:MULTISPECIES: peptide-methionine (S)-S-oxide reductase MsrA [Micrococcaceae]MDO4240889.1 peptide-methionine (S)-S-oxide reductase MsrA [Micrococcus sp.]MDR6892888.1 peptide-methionine (S)-S-oxide reductase [Falsarthrobacter nasiphocae]